MKKTLIISALLLALLAPQLAIGNSTIVSTIKTPDPYENNSSWFRFYESPGKTIKDSIILRNIGNKAETVKIYATDANVNQAGSFTPKMENEDQKGLGLWTEVSQNEITIDGGENKEIEFEITLPDNISPGQYFGSIIYEKVGNGCDEMAAPFELCKGNIQIKTRAGNRIYLTVPGKAKYDISLENMNWKRVEPNKILFTFHFINNGNIAFEPKAIVHIYNAWGQEIDTLEGVLGKSLPLSSTAPMLEWQYDQNFGTFTAKTEIYYLEKDQGRFDNLRGTILSEKMDINIFIFPWTLAIYLITILTLITIGIYTKHRHFQNMLKNTFIYTVNEDDDILNVAKNNKVKWKDIAKINNIKPPYLLKPNSKIKIPSSQNK